MRVRTLLDHAARLSAGQMMVYHVGYLAMEVVTNKVAAAVAVAFRNLAEQGLGHLTQVRLGHARFEYRYMRKGVGR